MSLSTTATHDFHRLAFQSFGFSPVTYKFGLTEPLIDRTFKINNTWMGFHKEIQRRNVWHFSEESLRAENIANNYICICIYAQTAVKGRKTQPRSGSQEVSKFCFKIALNGHFWTVAQRRIRKPVD